MWHEVLSRVRDERVTGVGLCALLDVCTALYCGLTHDELIVHVVCCFQSLLVQWQSGWRDEGR